MASDDEMTTAQSVRQERSLVSDLAPGRVAPLRRMVTEAKTDVAACAALRRLAEHGTRAAVNGVRDALDDPRSGVRAEAALLIGRLGSADDYERVAAIRIRSPRPLRKIRFGAVLLAHRHGLERAARARMEDVSTVPPGALDLSPIEISPDRADLVSGAHGSPPVDAVGGGALIQPVHTFGVAVAAAGPVLQCGTDPTVVLAAESALRRSVDAVVARPQVLAVGVSPAQEVDSWSPDWVALSTPSGDGVAIRVYSSSGRLQFAGTGTVEGHELIFELGPVEGASGPQVVLEGMVGDGALTIISAWRARRAEPGRKPTSDIT